MNSSPEFHQLNKTLNQISGERQSSLDFRLELDTGHPSPYSCPYRFKTSHLFLLVFDNVVLVSVCLTLTFSFNSKVLQSRCRNYRPSVSESRLGCCAWLGSRGFTTHQYIYTAMHINIECCKHVALSALRCQQKEALVAREHEPNPREDREPDLAE